MLRRLLCLFMIACLLALPFAAPARALVVVDDIIIAAVIAFGAACGLTLAFTGLDARGAISSTSDLLQQYLTFLGISSISAWVDGSTIIALGGFLRLPAAVCDAFTGFWDWVQDHYSLGHSGSAVVSSSSDYIYPEYSTAGVLTVDSLSDPVSLFYDVLSKSIDVSKISAYYFTDISASDVETLIEAKGSGFFCFQAVVYTSTVSITGGYRSMSVGDTITLGEVADTFIRIRGSISDETVDGVTYYYGNLYSVGAGSGYFDTFTGLSYSTENGANKASNLDASVHSSFTSVSASSPSLPATVPVTDFGWIDVAAPDDYTLDEVTDTVIDQAIDGELVPVLTISETEPGPLEPTPSPSPPPALPGWPEQLPTIPQGSITDKLPFCIPGDLLRIVSALEADPVAPVLALDFSSMGLEDTVITLDLSEFDDVAVICRRLELVLFAVGLAVATRRIYIRG